MITNEILEDEDFTNSTPITDNIERETNISQNIQENKETDQTQNTSDDKYPVKRNTVVTFAPRHTSIPFNDDREPACVESIEQDDELVLKENLDINRLYSSNMRLTQSDTSKKSTDEFTQTFFKSMIKLSNRR
ncbi:uncharacterized protein LOC126857049 [Cataglyphis hispanica]|uniref:uncharacterized protein LOC126857049 n=1 Tax=Cataglyphis hispanica TaxID=1086592 RepID=UPI00217FBDDA|nr:uncharacterized protein LOC126857049 [Cataglyphis hispanica]